MILEQLLTNDSPLVTTICVVCAIPVALFILESIKRSIYRMRWNRKHRDHKMSKEEFLEFVIKNLFIE